MLKLIDITELQVGMYVTQVTEQQGTLRVASAGKITTQSQITDLVNKGIKQLEIDLSKSNEINSEQDLPLDERNENGLNYGQQLERALKLYENAKTAHHHLMKRFRNGKQVNLDEVNAISQQIMSSVFESEDTINIVTLIGENDHYFIEHSVNCAILIVLFARYLGFEEKLTAELGSGALLMDIGMTKLPLLLTEKPESFNQADTKKMHRHVKLALDMVKNIELLSDTSREVIELHHERLDGSGYPEGLDEQHISVYGRMAAIVDVYDSLTSKRPYRDAYKPSEALRLLSDEFVGFDKELVAKFILCIGAHPIGSLVKLASGKLAIVMRLNRHKPLKPVVMVFYDLATKSSEEPSQLNLAQHNDTIINSVDPKDFDMNLMQFLQKTLLSQTSE